MKTKAKTKSRRARGLDPAVFLEAARRIGEDKESFCCPALEPYGWPSRSDEVIYFTDLLKPPRCSASEAWYGWSDLKNNQTARMLGLCLCAILIAEGFDPEGAKP